LPDKKHISKTDLEPFASSLEKIANSASGGENTKIEDVICKIYTLSNDLKRTSIIIKGLLDSFDIIFYIKDTSLNYVVANKAFFRNLSLHSTYKVIGKKDNEFFNSREASFNRMQDEEVLYSGMAIRNIEQYIPGTKKHKTGLVSKIPILDNEDKIVGIIGVFIDITERKKAQEFLELLEHNINTISEGLIIWNEQKCLYMNDSCESIFEYPKKLYFNTGKEVEFLLKNCIHSDDVERLQEYTINKNWPDTVTYRAKTPSDKEKWIEVERSNTEFEGKKCHAIVMRDVTETVILKNYNEVLVKAINKSEVTILLHSSNTAEIIYFEGIDKITGEALDKFTSGKVRLNDFVHPEDKKSFYCLEKLKIQMDEGGEIPSPLEVRIIDKKNNLKWIRISYIFFEKNNISYFGGIILDITKKKLSEDKVNDIARSKEIEIARKLKLENIQVDIIAKTTGLEIEQIESL